MDNSSFTYTDNEGGNEKGVISKKREGRERERERDRWRDRSVYVYYHDCA
jgi:hypothetical protein